MDKPNDSTASEALRNFIDGIDEKMDPNFGRVSSCLEEREVKRRIARHLGVGEKYHHNLFVAVNEDLENGTHDCREARAAVEKRYEELLEKGKIQEDPEYANREGEGIFYEVNRRLLEGHSDKD